MFIVKKHLEISAAHRLTLDYPSKCQTLHGHNWNIDVTCQSETLDHNGMVCDFTLIKQKIEEKLDHQDITDVMGKNPTAENIAYYIATLVGPLCTEVQVQESAGNLAIWKRS